MSGQVVENMTSAQKSMAAMVMETATEDVEAHRAPQRRKLQQQLEVQVGMKIQ